MTLDVDIVRYEYDRAKVVPRLLAVLGMVVIMTIWTLRTVGKVASGGDWIGGLTLLGVGWSLCIFLAALLVKMLIRPVYLRITRTDLFEFRQLFRVEIGRLAAGTELSFSDAAITIRAERSPFGKVVPERGIVTIPIPKGLRPVGSGTTTIAS